MARKRKKGKKSANYLRMAGGKKKSRGRSRSRRRGGKFDPGNVLKGGAMGGLWALLGALASKLIVGYMSAEVNPLNNTIVEKAEVNPLLIALGALAPGLALSYWDRQKGELAIAGSLAMIGAEMILPKIAESAADSDTEAIQLMAVGAMRPATLGDFGIAEEEAPDYLIYGDPDQAADRFAIEAGEDFAIGAGEDFAIGNLAGEFAY